jgi:chromosome segregation ATPase
METTKTSPTLSTLYPVPTEENKSAEPTAALTTTDPSGNATSFAALFPTLAALGLRLPGNADVLSQQAWAEMEEQLSELRDQSAIGDAEALRSLIATQRALLANREEMEVEQGAKTEERSGLVLERDSLKVKAAGLQSASNALQVRIDKVGNTSEKEALEADKAAVDAELDSVNGQIAGLDTDINQLDDDIAGLSAAIAQSEVIRETILRAVAAAAASDRNENREEADRSASITISNDQRDDSLDSGQQRRSDDEYYVNYYKNEYRDKQSKDTANEDLENEQHRAMAIDYALETLDEVIRLGPPPSKPEYPQDSGGRFQVGG